MSDVDIVLQIATQGVEDVYKLSNAMTQLNRAVNNVANPMKNLDARSRALSAAVGSANSSINSHAKSVSGLVKNQVVLSNETARVRKELAGLGTQYNLSTRHSADWAKQGIKDLQNYEKALKRVKLGALVSDLKSVAQEQKRLGKDAQFVGRSLIIGLTTPLAGFARFGLQSLVAIDKEFVRLTKVLEGIAPNIDAAAKKMDVDLVNATSAQTSQLNKLVDSYNELDKSLTATSVKFGLSKSLTVGLAGDFAELGIQSTKSIAEITKLTAATEKLGGMDIGAAKDLVQSLYFQARRAIMQSGEGRGLSAADLETRAIDAARAQLNLFNLVENQTALSMKDLGDAFPEAAAAATTFGLSMTETAALLAPMKAAGMEVGASANAIKISLQSIVTPTVKTEKMFASLTDQYGDHFKLIKGTGLQAIQSLIDAYVTLDESAAGQEGVLQFFSQVFGKRQGTRMLLPIQQLAEFDRVLKDVTKTEDSADKKIQDLANNSIMASRAATGANIPLIKSFTDIGIVARMATAVINKGETTATVEGFGKVSQKQIDAAKAARNEVARGIKEASQNEGIDLIGKTATEAGKIMYIELAGVKNAQEVADRELEISLGSLDTTIQRIKNSFKMFAGDLIKTLGPSIKKIADVISKLYSSWEKLSPATKKITSQLVIGFGALAAAIGPLIFAFGQARLALGSVGKAMFGLFPALKTLTVESVASRSAMLRLTKPLTTMGDTVVNTSGKFATFIATIASGGGPLAKYADKLGQMTGVLQKTTTANSALTKSVFDVKNPLRNSLGMASGVSGSPISQPKISRFKQFVSTEDAFKDQTGLGLTKTGRVYTKQGGAFSTKKQVGARFLKSSTLNLDDFNAIINRRLDAMTDAGVRTGEGADAGKRFFQSKFGKERQVSEKGALRIARGGIGGAVEKGKLGSIGAITSSIDSAKAFPTKAVASYTTAIAASKASVKALKIETLAMSGVTPGAFARMKAAVMGFARSFKIVDTAIKLTKLTLIASGIGAVLLAIGVGFILIKNNMNKFKESGASGLKVVGQAFTILKDALLEIVRPVIDLFAHFGKGSTGAAGAVEGIGTAFGKVANVLKWLAGMFALVVKKFIQPYLYMIVNIVAAVVSLFQGNWKKAFSFLMTAVAFAVDFFVNAFAIGFKLIVSLAGGLVKGVVSILGMLGKLIIENTVLPITSVLKVASMLPLGIGDKFKGINDKFRGVVNGAKGMVDSATGAVNGVVSSAVNGTNGLIDKAAGGLKNKVKGLKKGGIDASTGKVKLKAEAELEVETDPAQEKIANAVGDGIETGADKGAAALAKKLANYAKSLKEEIQNAIQDRIKDKIKQVVEDLTDGLKTQKEQSLKIFDDQLDKLEAVAKAEERLTKTKEYENKKRELEEKRALNKLNSQRNYALAIYEGRIDDARQISLEQRRSEVESQKELTDLNTSRDKEVADEKKQDVVDAIKKAKEESAKYFDQMIDDFKKAAERITKFPPTTADKFNEQLQLLVDAAKDYGTKAGDKFSENASSVLGDLGTDATEPLKTSLAVIDEVLKDNNPFGPTGVWQTTIDDVIRDLTAKYQGLSDTMTTIFDDTSDAYTKLFETYTKYKDLVKAGEEDAGTGSGTDTTTTTPTTPVTAPPAVATPPSTTKPPSTTTSPSTGSGSTPEKVAADVFSKKYPNYQGPAAPKIIAEIVKIINYNNANLSAGGSKALSWYIKANKDWDTGIKYMAYSTAVKAMTKSTTKTPGYANGGLVPGFNSQGVSAMLHGGEYVVNSNAVKNIGLAALQSMNDMRFNTPKSPSYAGPQQSQENSSSSVNIYVDNFIGERQWFESMMKDYNVKVGPQNQKNAGLQSRTISTYNGINRGL